MSLSTLLATNAPASVSPARLVAAYPALLALLQSGKPFRADAVFAAVTDAVGGTMANAAFTARDAYDAMEYALNRSLGEGVFGALHAEDDDGLDDLVNRMAAVVACLPTQTRRNEETQEFQMFSTPPTLAALLVHALGIAPGEVALDSSAGVASLLTFARAAGARPVANELSPRRAALVRALGVSFVSCENAEYIDSVLPTQHRPDVVIMNPPFSATAGRRQGFRRSTVGARHVERAALCLPENGRLVTLVGTSLDHQSPAFRDMMSHLKGFRLAADIGLPGELYKAFGTTYDNRVLVIDRATDGADPLIERAADLDELRGMVQVLRANAPVRSANVPAGQLGLEFTAPAVEIEAVAAPVSGPAATPVPAAKPAKAKRLTGKRGKAAAIAARESAIVMPEGPVEPLKITVLDEAGRAAFEGDGIFETYLPQRIAIEGAQPHPDALVESAPMAAVLAPIPTHRPHLPAEIVTGGHLSLPQLEAVVYAGHSHNQFLPSGERRGFFIGDGTGVGKGREISGIILDNWLQGRRRALWISEKPDLLTDARRDFAAVLCDPQLIQPQSQFRQHESLVMDQGVMFTTYATLRQSSKESQDTEGNKVMAPSRLDQMVKWLGQDFDGCIVFDESHAGGNAVEMKGERGTLKPSQQALCMVELQERLPQARVVYVSATGATEVHNLSYATRLGLWGPGTPFTSVQNFISQVAGHGISVAEIVARDMKAMGVYLARSLSYADVTYSRCEQELTPDQVAIYDRLSDAWQLVLKNVEAALSVSGGDRCSNTKAAAKSAFWGSSQRFWNQIVTSMQMPAVLNQIDEDLGNGKSVVLQLVNTFEAAQARAIARAQTQEDLDQLDITPRDILMQYIENSFPVLAHEEYTDDNGVTRTRVACDSKENPIRSPEAEQMRAELLRDLVNIQVPDSPLDIILNIYGPDAVAEVTGRSRRAVRRIDPASGDMHTQLEPRSRVKAHGEAADFMAGKRRILIFSDAGGTGFSFHAARDCQNQQQRMHYLLQPGWRANKAVQGFGRTHRTNAVSAPHYRLCTTDLPGHRRFLSSIARRLDTLGALTKGHRDSANQGLFSAKDNLESAYAVDAITDLFRSLYIHYRDGIDGLTFSDLCEEMGLQLEGEDGGLNVSKIPSVPQFLNRLLCLKVERQNQVFEAFISRMEAAIDRARQAGELDVGMEDLEGERINLVKVETVYTDEKTGARTEAVTLDAHVKIEYQWFPTHMVSYYVRNLRSGRVWAIRELPPRTAKGGNIVEQVRVMGTGSSSVRDAREIMHKFETIPAKLARELWQAEIDAAPTHRIERHVMLTGLLLNVWDRITGRKKIARACTEDGRRLLGCVVNPHFVDQTLEALGASAADMDAATVHKAVMEQGQTATLTNRWKLVAARVAGERRLEVLVGMHDYRAVAAACALGAFEEYKDFKRRVFLPVDNLDVLTRLLESHPVTKLYTDEDQPLLMAA